ncbi:hypothetical protein GCM10009122_44430 [Fulvivirga kasyanovii]|uniref:Uncharacterized protein n=1 Tax=Fulvivirga kasyanovii TaxID=396812 RepID=A0ABW9RJH8_9BACT|nr:hypothetical protein [Fulvivirga kasyanovii]MTI24085.1 hypothetical protein [Fulvivirga kasyanovii]
MKDSKEDQKTKHLMLISSLNAIIDQLPVVVKAYKDAQLNFATAIYESDNAAIFDRSGNLPDYENEIVEILALFQQQLESLQAARDRLA